MIRYSPNANRAHMISWQEWSDAAFQQARAENKPVMLFLAAFWCRYCQRMDEAAFSDTEVIALLNAYFIPLRVDYAQRPDVDARYNLNGWPTIAFLAPGGRLLGGVNFLPAGEFKERLLDVYLAYQRANEELGNMVEKSAEPQRAARVLTDGELAGNLAQITESIMALADRTHGGYDRGQKFIHSQVNDFLLARYADTKEPRYLDQVCLTLERMRGGELYDRQGGAYFRTASNPDWSHPHREKLLVEQAGLLANCLTVFRLTERSVYRRMAEEIIEYLDAKLFDPASGTFFGCEDWLREENPAAGDAAFFTIIDRCCYTDANAMTCTAYLDAASLLNRPQDRERALVGLDFLWRHCRDSEAGMFHFFDGAPHVPGLLQDQAQMGIALLRAYEVLQREDFLQRAQELAEIILAALKNPTGGFYDVRAEAAASLGGRLTLIEQNGAAALFFFKLAAATDDANYRQAAKWALCAFTGDFAQYGVHAASYGQALGAWLAAANP